MNLKRKFHQDLNQYATPASPIAETHRESAAYRPRKKWLTAPVAVAMAVLLTIGVAAAGVTVAQYLNRDILTENNLRLTEVPEGYVGIYSVEDLVQMAEDVRNGTNARHYILMSDITFTDADYAEGGICEGGWVPLDARARSSYLENGEYIIFPELKVFRGNGHVIRNLKIQTPVVSQKPNGQSNGMAEQDSAYFGLFGVTSAEITHLGIEGCEIVVDHTVTDPFASYSAYYHVGLGVTVHVGAIAGYADYIGGCYVKDLDIRLNTAFAWREDHLYQKEQFADTVFYNLNVGGIAGSTTYADACYAENVSIRVRTEGEPYAKLYAGLLAGRATSCITSWAQGTVEAEGEAYRTKEIAEIACNYPSHSFPTVVPQEAFDQLLEKVDAHYGTDTFRSKLIRAYFVRKDIADTVYALTDEDKAALEALVQSFNDRYTFVSGKETNYTSFYVFDPTSSPLELERIGTLITAAFATEEEYLDYCRAHDIRLGVIDCLTLTPDQKVTAEDLANFNLETLWTITDGKPRLRVFAN